MYFNNLFGNNGAQSGATALTSPPDYRFAALLGQQPQQHQPIGGPQIPVAGMHGGAMGGMASPNLSPGPQSLPGGASSSPQSSSLASVLQQYGIGGAGGLGNALQGGQNGAAGPNKSPMLFDLGQALGLGQGGLFGGGNVGQPTSLTGNLLPYGTGGSY